MAGSRLMAGVFCSEALTTSARLGGNSVKARLFCGASTVSSDSGTVMLEPNGDFRIDGSLAPVPPTPCTNPVLLIVSATNGNWFAAGIPK